jgi:hypothetical protein
MRKQRPVNLVIEKAAFDNGVLVIDGNRAFERAIAEGHAIRDLIDLEAGPHPTALLYGYIVEALAPIVDAALGQRAG